MCLSSVQLGNHLIVYFISLSCKYPSYLFTYNRVFFVTLARKIIEKLESVKSVAESIFFINSIVGKLEFKCSNVLGPIN